MIVSNHNCPKCGNRTLKHCQDGSTSCDLIVCQHHGWGTPDGRRWVESAPSVR